MIPSHLSKCVPGGDEHHQGGLTEGVVKKTASYTGVGVHLLRNSSRTLVLQRDLYDTGGTVCQHLRIVVQNASCRQSTKAPSASLVIGQDCINSIAAPRSFDGGFGLQDGLEQGDFVRDIVGRVRSQACRSLDEGNSSPLRRQRCRLDLIVVQVVYFQYRLDWNTARLCIRSQQGIGDEEGCVNGASSFG